jgi:hypothetical protein
MTAWQEKGCAVCRHQWETGAPPPEIAVNIAMHASLHRCPVCGTYWERTERLADVIDPGRAATLFPSAILQDQPA